MSKSLCWAHDKFSYLLLFKTLRSILKAMILCSGDTLQWQIFILGELMGVYLFLFFYYYILDQNHDQLSLPNFLRAYGYTIRHF